MSLFYNGSNRLTGEGAEGTRTSRLSLYLWFKSACVPSNEKASWGARGTLLVIMTLQRDDESLLRFIISSFSKSHLWFVTAVFFHQCFMAEWMEDRSRLSGVERFPATSQRTFFEFKGVFKKWLKYLSFHNTRALAEETCWVKKNCYRKIVICRAAKMTLNNANKTWR